MFVNCVFFGAERRGFLRNPISRRRGFSRRYAPNNPDSLQERPCKASTVFFVLSYPKTSFFLIQFQKFRRSVCGEAGIRTPETLLEFTRFPGVPLKPLEHLSFVGRNSAKRIGVAN